MKVKIVAILLWGCLVSFGYVYSGQSDESQCANRVELTTPESEKRPTVCVNMIVKDETPVIRRCLQSVKPIIDYWVIVDTGSTDGTQQMIKEFMQDVPGELHERPWVNFGHNRNEALALAKDKADYILVIDADEVLEFTPDFQLPHLDKDCYYIETYLSETRYKRVQLINNHLHWNWYGVVHEALGSREVKTYGVLAGATNIPRSDGNRSQDPKKFYKDIALLEKALIDEPYNTRYAFYLAQSYKDAGEYEKSIEAYHRRIAMGGFDQEIFWSLYQIGLLKELLKRPTLEVVQAYEIAYSYRPTRLEPLYRLASFHRMQGNMKEAFKVAERGILVKKPDDLLFVEEWMYQYGILMEYSVAAYWEGHYMESLLTTKLMLSVPTIPDNFRECGKQNLMWASRKLEEQN